jgi:hypothetical protein
MIANNPYLVMTVGSVPEGVNVANVLKCDFSDADHV